jgi:hypothetical protein
MAFSSAPAPVVALSEDSTVGNDQGRSTLLKDRTKEQRERELQELLETRTGRIQVWNLFARYHGCAEGRLPPGGPVLIQVILAYEFPHV